MYGDIGSLSLPLVAMVAGMPVDLARKILKSKLVEIAHKSYVLRLLGPYS